MRRPLRRLVGVTLVGAGLLAMLPAAVLAQDGGPKITVSLVQAALIGFGYYMAQGPWLFGMGFFTLYRPLVAGFFVGLILGDPAEGDAHRGGHQPHLPRLHLGRRRDPR